MLQLLSARCEIEHQRLAQIFQCWLDSEPGRFSAAAGREWSKKSEWGCPERPALVR